MRAVRLFGVVALAAALCAALGAGLVTAWTLSRSAPADRSGDIRTDAPTALGTDRRLPMRVRIEPVPAAVPGERAPLERRVLVENPTARPASGLRVATTVTGGACDWVDGPFPTPFGLAPGADTGRTCRVAVDAGHASATVEVTVHAGTNRVAAASDTVTAPPPSSTAAAPSPAPDAAPTPRPQRSVPPPAGPTTTITALPCPGLADGLDLGATPGLDRLGPAITDRARLIEVEGCPEWEPVAGLLATRPPGDRRCPPWELRLAPDSDPVALLSGPQQDGCPALPLEVEVRGSGTGRAAQLATLAAWSVEGRSGRVPVLHRAAVTGTAARCAGAGSVALSPAYEQHAGGQRIYRVTVLGC